MSIQTFFLLSFLFSLWFNFYLEFRIENFEYFIEFPVENLEFGHLPRDFHCKFAIYLLYHFKVDNCCVLNKCNFYFNSTVTNFIVKRIILFVNNCVIFNEFVVVAEKILGRIALPYRRHQKSRFPRSLLSYQLIANNFEQFSPENITAFAFAPEFK